MANPLPFKPLSVDPRSEHARQLAAAPTEHAEALLVAWDLLQTAHDQGILDLLNGLVGAKNTVAGKLADYALLPESIAAMRNLISLMKILSAFEPETLDCIAEAVRTASIEHREEVTPPSLFRIARRAMSEDSRRGLSFLTLLLSGLGQSLG
jgi:uncharacterized protein YjgD (DUF1641 family)